MRRSYYRLSDTELATKVMFPGSLPGSLAASQQNMDLQDEIVRLRIGGSCLEEI